MYPTQVVFEMTVCLLTLLGDFYDTYNAYTALLASAEIRRAIKDVLRIRMDNSIHVDVITIIKDIINKV